MGKELVVNLGHVLHLCLYSSYWLSGKRQRRRAFLKVVLFRSSTLSPSARPQVTCSHPLCVWRWADSLLFTTNPFLPPGPSVFTRRISLTSWPWVFYLLVTFSLPEPPSPVVTPWILHPRKLLSFWNHFVPTRAFSPSSFLIYLSSPWCYFALIAASRLVAGPLHQVHQHFPSLLFPFLTSLESVALLNP